MENIIVNYFKGRGAQYNPNNKFNKQQYVQEHVDGLDEEFLQKEKTEIIFTYPKTIINKVESTDIGLGYSLNPYQGCEHGCIYCYARNSHEFIIRVILSPSPFKIINDDVFHDCFTLHKDTAIV